MNLESLTNETYLVLTAVALAGASLAFLGAVLWRRAVENRLRGQIEDQRIVNDSQSDALRQHYEEQLKETELRLVRTESANQSLTEQLTQLQEKNQQLEQTRSEFLQLKVRYEEQSERREAEQALIEQTKNQLFKEFELAAGKLFEAKQQKFESASKASLEHLLQPFREQLGAFHKRVEDVYHKENTQRNQLIGQIAELQKQAQQISADANNLASALKNDNKVQGNWGEIVLERLLEQSGLQKGREYDTQKKYTSASGATVQPDVVVHLPDSKDIVIDSKVSLVDYERYSTADTQQEREQALKAHLSSIRAHVKGLSLKQYESIDGVRTLDFVFVFIPVEAAYVAAIQAAPALFKEAYDRNIVLVSPSSLMVALRTVETIWRYEKQNANAEKIASSAGRLFDQFSLFVESLEDIGKNIDRAQDSFTTARKRLVDGRGNLLRRIETLRELGAKTSRQLPDGYQTETAEQAYKDDNEPASLPDKH